MPTEPAFDPTLWAIPFFLATMALEAWVLARRGTPYEWRDSWASLSGGFGNLAVKVGWKVVTFWVFTWLYQFRVYEWGTGWVAWVALLFAEDLCYYAYHRASHEIRFLWATHVVHHSSLRYTLTTALRQSWTAPVVGLVFWLPLPLLGFEPWMIMVQMGISLVYQYWIHTETIGRLWAPIEWVFNTPSHHRVHHGSNERYLDRNHGGIFIIWDRLFGTFEPEKEPVVYGILKNVNSFHPVWIQFHALVELWEDLRRAKGPLHALRMIFGPPGGLPEDQAVPPTPAG